MAGPIRPSIAAADEPPGAASKAIAVELFRGPDPDDATKETVLLSVKFAPGVSSAPHRHPGFLVGYVLAGELEFQLEGGSLEHLKPGDHFYEPPGALHLVSRNPGSLTTEVLVFSILPKGQPIVLPTR